MRMARHPGLNSLRDAPAFDLAVVGGGATGLGVALAAAQRGHSVVLFESSDFASGTSSRSTKLLHGGVRYLSQGNIRLVREALHERSALMDMAPHLAQPLPFVMPLYRRWHLPLYGLGLKIYDGLAGADSFGRSQVLNRQQTIAALPGVCEQGLVGGVQYWDGQFEDARFALTLAKALHRMGGVPLNYTRVTRVERVQSRSSARFVVHAVDEIGGQSRPVQAQAVVNATGVWVDALRHSISPSTQSRLVTPSQGVHMVVSQNFLPSGHALIVPKTADGRVLFAVPWLGSLVIGTTDTPRTDVPLHPLPFEHELTFLLTEARRALARPVERHDVKSVWVGLRPLVAVPDAGLTASLSREHTVVTDDQGMVSVTGGKWTTFRVMAQDALKACIDAGVMSPRLMPAQAPAFKARGQGRSLTLPPGIHLYGSQSDELSAWPGAQNELCPGLTEAMVRYAAQQEWATCVEDMLARRSRLLFLDAALAIQVAPKVAEILRQETGIDPRLEDFMTLARQYQMPAEGTLGI